MTTTDLKLDEPGSLPRPGPVGRLVRLGRDPASVTLAITSSSFSPAFTPPGKRIITASKLGTNMKPRILSSAVKYVLLSGRVSGRSVRHSDLVTASRISNLVCYFPASPCFVSSRRCSVIAGLNILG